jgi:hypothetical protein
MVISGTLVRHSIRIPGRKQDVGVARAGGTPGSGQWRDDIAGGRLAAVRAVSCARWQGEISAYLSRRAARWKCRKSLCGAGLGIIPLPPNGNYHTQYDKKLFEKPNWHWFLELLIFVN